MATAKTSSKVPSSKTAVKAPAIPSTKTASDSAAAVKPIKSAFNKTGLVVHLAGLTGADPKAARAFLAALEATVLASVHKKGIGEFTWPGLLKISAQSIPAKKKRFGKDPFSGEERWFAAKPASVKIKARPLKKLKDAAL